MQEKDEAVRAMQAAAAAAEERHLDERAAAAAQPLESSQRAVIRDLSSKVTALLNETAQLKSERDRALVTSPSFV